MVTYPWPNVKLSKRAHDYFQLPIVMMWLQNDREGMKTRVSEFRKNINAASMIYIIVLMIASVTAGYAAKSVKTAFVFRLFIYTVRHLSLTLLGSSVYMYEKIHIQIFAYT